MSVVRTRHQVELQPSLSTTQENVGGNITIGDPTEGVCTIYRQFTADVSYFAERVFTNADTITNLNPAGISIEDWPLVKRADLNTPSSGTILLSLNGVGRRVSFDYRFNTIGSSYKQFHDFKSGTLLQFLDALIRPTANTEGKDSLYYKLKTGGAVIPSNSNYANVEKNLNCWAAGWDFSGVPIWNSNANGPGKNGAMITQQHLVEAQHYARPVGTVFRFLGTDGQIVERTSIGRRPYVTFPNSSETYAYNARCGDIMVHTLNAPVPPTVTHYPIVGDWVLSNYSAGAASGGKGTATANSQTLFVYLDRNRRACWLGQYDYDCLGSSEYYQASNWEGHSISVYWRGFGGGSTSNSPVYSTFGPNYKFGESGDSGSGLFVPLSASSLAVGATFFTPAGGDRFEQGLMNALIAASDADALTRNPSFNGGVPTGLTVTVAPDPTL